MSNIVKAFDSAFRKKKERNWDYIYVLIDIHDTIFKGYYTNNDNLELTDPYTVYALRLMSKNDSVKLILWSSQYSDSFKKYIDYLNDFYISIDYINENPEVINTDIQCFDSKPYFNVGIDDKFGFEPEDWEEIFKYFEYKRYEKI